MYSSCGGVTLLSLSFVCVKLVIFVLHSNRSETDITNVVEQRIWHSMEEGQFENLPGKGKPLDLSINPHADPAEDTLYRILSRNKCLPEWVELNKEIRSNIAEWRSALHRATVHREGGNNSKWIECSEALKVQLRSINNKVSSWAIMVLLLCVNVCIMLRGFGIQYRQWWLVVPHVT